MTESSPYIFISHSSKDKTFAHLLAGKLGAAGFETWFDVEDIPDGSTWAREIERGVQGCGAMIVVWSRSARDSEWVEREVLMAMQLRKRVLIAVIDDDPLPIYLINRQATDCAARPEAGISRLITQLRRVPLTAPLEPKPGEAKKLSPNPNEHNFFKYLEQLPEGGENARIARALFAFAEREADGVTFSGRSVPAFHAHIWIGPGGVSVFSVRAFRRMPSVEIPLQYLQNFPPYTTKTARREVLNALNALLPPREQLPPDRADLRPGVPLARALGSEAGMDAFQTLVREMVARLRQG